MRDHIHILIGYHPSQPLPDLMRDIKSISSKFINDRHWLPGEFQWQEGYGAFSYARSQLSDVINYINKQEDHHKKFTFKEEYMKFLKKFDVDYDERYLFDWT